jgi:hypothetical protein
MSISEITRFFRGLSAVLSLILGFLSLIISAGCDAPRHNPLDPENPENIYRRLSGHVQTFSLPRDDLENVAVQWQVNGSSIFTNSNGVYNLETTDARDEWLFFEKTGFFSDSVFIVWNSQRTVINDVYLNSRPSLDSLRFYSVIINRYPSLHTEQAVFESWISDPDNDIDTVSANITPSPVLFTLNYNPALKAYERTFSPFDLDVDHLEECVGYPAAVRVRDAFAHVSLFDVSNLTRVIRDEVHFRSPSGNEGTGPEPILSWDIFSVPFEFTYTIEIFTAEITPELKWRKEGIDMFETNIQVDLSLPDGPYYWVIWAIDLFGNRTRSKPASFTVEPAAG